MQSLESRVLATITNNDLIPRGRSIIAAVSGGPDSVALLCLLARLLPRGSLAAIYVDHQLRPGETGAEQELVAALCRSLSIDCHLATVDVPAALRQSGESPEACARTLRYRELERIRRQRGADLIAVGHTSDDQVEEVLLRLIRGSGLKGLTGMDLHNDRIIRPLLETPKAELLDYLERNRIRYCVDSSNQSRTYLRNRIRLDLLPLLEQRFNPAIRQTVRNTATILKDEEAYLADAAEQAFRALRPHGGEAEFAPGAPDAAVDSGALLQHHPALARRLVEKLCWNVGCRPTFSAIEEILDLARHGRSGAERHLPDGLRVIKTATHLVFSPHPRPEVAGRRQDSRFDSVLVIDAAGAHPVPALHKTLLLEIAAPSGPSTGDRLVLDADRVRFPLVLRAPAPGETFRPPGAPGRKKVGRFLSDRKIPGYLRHRYPVLVSEERIIAILGLTVSDEVRTSRHTARYLAISWLAG